MTDTDQLRRLADVIEPATHHGARPIPGAPDPFVALLERFPPRAVPGSWTMTALSNEQVMARLLAAPFAPESAWSQRDRRRGLTHVLQWLEQQPGDTWQDRWIASRADAEGTSPGESCRLNVWRHLDKEPLPPDTRTPRSAGGCCCSSWAM